MVGEFENVVTHGSAVQPGLVSRRLASFDLSLRLKGLESGCLPGRHPRRDIAGCFVLHRIASAEQTAVM